MAKDNLFLGTARGSVGDVVFSRSNGVQVARARNRAPRNPQSPAQMVQRIIMSSVGKAYSAMQEICNHSFEGFETGQQSQRKFMEVNVGLLRDSVASVLAYPVEEVVKSSDATNFSFKNDYAPVLNRYMISAGSLPSIALYATTEESRTGVQSLIPLSSVPETPATMTYAQVIQALGFQRGDQLTFVQVTHDTRRPGHDADLITGFRYSRVILDPASGDLSVPFLASSGNAVNDPNERNSGSFGTLRIDAAAESRPAGLLFILPDVTTTGNSDRFLAGSAVIVSRQVGGLWRRSTQFLEPRWVTGADALKSSPLNQAYESFRLASASDLYLNQAT